MQRSHIGVIQRITDLKTKEITWTKEGKENKATIYSKGIFIKQDDGTESWHNVESSSQQKVDELLNNIATNKPFQPGERINLFEKGKENNGKTYYKIKSIVLMQDATPSTDANNLKITKETVEDTSFGSGDKVNEIKVPSVDRRIVRQNSLSQSNELVKSLLKQVELGIIPKEHMSTLTVQTVTGFAKQFEEWVFRES